MRRLVTPVGLLVAAAVIAGCGGSSSDSSTSTSTSSKPSGSSVAVTANTTKIPSSQVVDELRTLTANQRLVKWYKAQDFKLVPHPGTIDADTASFWLNTIVQASFIDREFARRKLVVDPHGRAAAREKVSEEFGGLKVFDGFPRQFQEKLIQRQLRLVALQKVLGPATPPTDATLRILYAAVQKQCPTGKLVSQTTSSTKAKANAIATELAAGTDFATVAEQRSEDKTSRPLGGRFTCVGAALYNQFDEPTRRAIEALPMGGSTRPIPVKGGYVVFHVDPMTYENMLPLLQAEYARTTFSPLASFLNQQMQSANPLKVNPRFGVLARTAAATAIAPRDGPVNLSN